MCSHVNSREEEEGGGAAVVALEEEEEEEEKEEGGQRRCRTSMACLPPSEETAKRPQMLRPPMRSRFTCREVCVCVSRWLNYAIDLPAPHSLRPSLPPFLPPSLPSSPALHAPPPSS